MSRVDRIYDTAQYGMIHVKDHRSDGAGMFIQMLCVTITRQTPVHQPQMKSAYHNTGFAVRERLRDLQKEWRQEKETEANQHKGICQLNIRRQT